MLTCNFAKGHCEAVPSTCVSLHNVSHTCFVGEQDSDAVCVVVGDEFYGQLVVGRVKGRVDVHEANRDRFISLLCSGQTQLFEPRVILPRQGESHLSFLSGSFAARTNQRRKDQKP